MVHRPRLRTLFVRYLLTTGLCCLAVVMLWWLVLLWLLQGLLLPASTAADACAAAVPRLETETAATFSPDLLDPLCRYVLFAEPGSDTVLATNMDRWHLKIARNAWHGGSGNLGYAQYHLRVDLADGSVCLLQYDYAVPYANPALRRLLPDFQSCYLVLLALLLGAVVLLNARVAGRRVEADIGALKTACRRIAAGELDGPDLGRGNIRELDDALAAMQQLRRALADSLQAQWSAEAQRTDQIRALAHDLKTPLTVIAGNAELLAEDDLSPAQAQCARDILRGADHARRYLAELRAITAGSPVGARTAIRVDEFLDARARTGRALCAPGRVNFVLQNALPADRTVEASLPRLARAVDNLLDNAARHTPAGGTVTLGCTEAAGFLRFTVEDTGPGFSPEALEKAGRLFYTGDSARPADGHQGLGLCFARTVAEEQGGRLCIGNRKDRFGARVTLELPVP